MEHIDEIQRDLACPKCEYNLRGLRGAVVDCPECGERCDIVAMVTQRWTKPWYTAPGLTELYAPCSWLVVMGVFGMPCFLSASQDRFQAMMTTLVFVGVYGVMMFRAWWVFRSAEGIRLSLLAHAIFAGYLAGVVPILFVIISIAMVALKVSHTPDEWLWPFVIGLILTPAGILLLRLGRRTERKIAERCIRHYLARRPR